MQMFVLPVWIHTCSHLTIPKAVKAGSDLLVRAAATNKWQRNGHLFINLAVAIINADEVVLKVEHTAIIRIAS